MHMYAYGGGGGSPRLAGCSAKPSASWVVCLRTGWADPPAEGITSQSQYQARLPGRRPLRMFHAITLRDGRVWHVPMSLFVMFVCGVVWLMRTLRACL